MSDTPAKIESPPPGALPAGPGNGIGPQPEDGPQPDQELRFEESEPTNPDGQTADPAVGQDSAHLRTLRYGAASASLTATAVLNEARSHLGFTEGSNNDNPFWQWPPFYTWLRWASYCASAATYCFYRTGGTSPGMAAVYGGHYNCAEWVSTFRRYGRFNSTGQRGDLVFFDWTGAKSAAEHVGIVESTSGGTVTAIEFNTSSGNAGSQSNGGGCYRRTRSTRFVVGFGRPVYGGEVNVTPISNPTHNDGKTILSIDGVWGAATTRRLQQYMGLKVDGQIGPNTRKALQKLVGTAQDGVWGPGTRKALQRFVGVKQDGAWGAATVKAFQRYLNRAGAHRTVTATDPNGSISKDEGWLAALAGIVTTLIRRILGYGRN